MGRDGRRHGVKIDLSRRSNNYLLRAKDTFEIIVAETTVK